MKKLLDFFKKDAIIVREYRRAACQYGEALSYSYLGKVIGLDTLESNFKRWEKKLEKQGYILPTIEEVVAFGGYGHELELLKTENKNGIHRERNEAC